MAPDPFASLRISAAGSRSATPSRENRACRGPRLRSRPLNASSFQRALNMGLGQLRGPSWEAGTLLHCTTQKSIFALGGLDVCDGAHGLIVMKKIRVRDGSQRQRARAPAPHIRKKSFVRKGGIPLRRHLSCVETFAGLRRVARAPPPAHQSHPPAQSLQNPNGDRHVESHLLKAAKDRPPSSRGRVGS